MLFYQLIYYLFFSLYISSIVKYEFTLIEAKLAPDNYVVDGILINNLFPGPTIEATSGDTVIIRVKNQLKKNITIHWHGITQRGSAKSDGVPYITQLPIQPNQTYDYKFDLYDQSGTYWYHAHTDMDNELAYGALIIKDKPQVWCDITDFNPKYKYDDEFVLLLSDRWHKTSKELMKGLTEAPFNFSNQSQSILTNGRTYQSWKNNLNGGTQSDLSRSNHGFSVSNVRPNKTYRIRLIAGNGFSLFTFTIENHNFTIIEADGTLVEPIEVDHIEMSSGQRYSILITTNQKIDNYFMYTQVSDEFRPEARLPAAKNGVAILHYKGAKNAQLLTRINKTVPGLKYELSRWVENQLVTSKWYTKGLSSHYYPVPKRVNKSIDLTVTLRFPNGLARWFVNDVEHKQRSTVLIDDVAKGKYKQPEQGIYDISEGDDVQIIIQHTMPKGFPCGVHPWHLHGHAFYVVGYGNGNYDPIKDGNRINKYLDTTTNIPILRDTYTHFVDGIPEKGKLLQNVIKRRDTTPRHMNMFSPPKSLLKTISPSTVNNTIKSEPPLNDNDVACGWYAIRFKANNPGSWFIHCHMSPHVVMGKVAVINYVSKK